MDLPTVAVSAVVGAVVAVGTYVVTDKLKEANARVQEAARQAYYDGRESVLQHFQMPADAREFANQG